jgi:ketosteroid isomerase-like protein
MLTTSQITRITAEVKQAATTHLHAKDVETALSRFADDVVAASNTELYSSRDARAVAIREYYRTLKKVNHASWKDAQIQVISESVATFTARFSYGFTSVDDTVTDLTGVWTALFVLDEEGWRIRLLHESVEQSGMDKCG